MYYSVSLDRSLNRWLVGDTPDVSGVIYSNGRRASDLLGVLVSANRARGVLFNERIGVLSSTEQGRFSFVFPNELKETTSGRLFVTVLADSGKSGTIQSTINDTDTSVGVDITDAPVRGHCLIESEWCEYTASGSTITFVKRGAFGTTAASHTSGAAIKFSDVKETATPWNSYETVNRNNL